MTALTQTEEIYTSITPISRLYLDRYKPSNLDQVVGNDQMISLLKYYVKEKNFPNMLIIGPTGCGKNTAISLFVKEFLGKYYSTHCLEIVGSLYRGRCIISQTSDTNKSNEKSIPNVSNFIKKSIIPRELKKIIIIYDFDYTTDETQMALRRLMETKRQNVRFILSSNSRNNIAETIQSRGNIYQFNPINNNEIKIILDHIVKNESLNVSSQIIDEIIRCSENNIRTAINNLQLISHTDNLSVRQFYELLNIPSVEYIENFYLACFRHDEGFAIKVIEEMLESGYSIVDLLNILQKTLILTNKLSVVEKNQLIEIISKFFILSETTLSTTNLYHLIYCLLN